MSKYKMPIKNKITLQTIYCIHEPSGIDNYHKICLSVLKHAIDFISLQNCLRYFPK